MQHLQLAFADIAAGSRVTYELQVIIRVEHQIGNAAAYAVGVPPTCAQRHVRDAADEEAFLRRPRVW